MNRMIVTIEFSIYKGMKEDNESLVRNAFVEALINRREYFHNGRLGLEDEAEALDQFIGTLVDETLTQLEIIHGIDDED